MRKAIDLALKAKGKTSPNPMVGALIVKDDRILGRGYHHSAGGPHAEILALRQASKRARGAVMYVTLEPCSHFGRTPPCVDAIISSGIKKVVIATKDPNPVNNGNSIKLLRRNGIQVMQGVLAKEAQEINMIFNKFITKKIPFVTVKVAQSLDGKIALQNGQSQWITSKETRDLAHRLRNDYDAILVGVNTVIHDNPLLKSKNKVIVDSRLRTSLNARIFTKNSGKVIIASTKKAPKQKVAQLEGKGATVLLLPVKNGKVNLKALMRQLAKMEITSVFIEGGGTIIGNLFDEGLVDKAMFFIAPKIIGGKDSISSVEGAGIKSIAKAHCLKDIRIQQCGNEFLLQGNVYRHN
ncbi:bifunctional diaminohydroxyphosphoribosylaminopyrimidine deaminase/5-amino-6-(5-phosphoribosylamino)uracil reductase RibD [Candidatus Omnitrophota bacterium]